MSDPRIDGLRVAHRAACAGAACAGADSEVVALLLCPVLIAQHRDALESVRLLRRTGSRGHAASALTTAAQLRRMIRKQGR